MLPPKPLAEMTDEEILTEIRRLRATRVAAKERAIRPRGTKKNVNDDIVAAAIAKALEEDAFAECEREE